MTAMKVQYCMGFWSIAGNPKRSAEHYDALLPRSLKMIAGRDLHLWHDGGAFAERVARLCKSFDITLTDEQLDLDALPARDAVEPILDTCADVAAQGGLARVPRDKESAQFSRYAANPDALHDLLSIWASKVPLSSNLAAQSRRHHRTCWIDASISKFSGRRRGWRFTRAALPPRRVSHYGSPMFFKGHALPLNASFIGSDEATWSRLNRLFWKHLGIAAKEGVIHDEETVLSRVVQENPHLFHCIGRPLRGVRALPAQLGVLAGRIGTG